MDIKMKHIFSSLFVLVMLYSNDVISQENRKGIHQLQTEQMSNEIITIAKKTNEEPIISIQQKASTQMELTSVVFGFLPAGEYLDGAHNNMRYEALSHIAVSFFEIQTDGSITNPSGWPWTDVINGAHIKGTKVIMAVSNFGISDNELSVILKSTTQKNNFFLNVKNTISTYNLDGVNIDFEAFNSTDRGTVIISFMAELTSYIHAQLPGKEVSFDSPAINWGGWDFSGLVDAVDHLFIMAYDYNQDKGSIADAVAPLYARSGYNKCVNRTITYDYASAVAKSPEKVILGVPYYGIKWKTNSSDIHSSIIPDSFLKWGTYRDYLSTRYKDDVVEIETNGSIWDIETKTPWYRWNDAGSWYQVYTDNVRSLTEKFDYTIANNLGGVGIWALNYDAGRTELWDLLEEKFSNGNSSACLMTATSTSEYFVRLVDIMDNDRVNVLLMNETSDDGGYGNYKTMNFDVDAGATFKAMIRGKIESTVQTYWKILVDLDKDGAFDGANETLLTKEGNDWGYYPIVIPSNTPIGSYVFRVAVSSTPFTSLCGSFTGEIEDYTINVTNSNLYLTSEEFSSIHVYPNPISNVLNIETSSYSVNVTIYSVLGNVVYKGAGGVINTSAWNRGLYFIQVQDGDKLKTIKVIK